MKQPALILAAITLLTLSCENNGPFAKKDLHNQYGKKLKTAGLDNTALGKQWFAAADFALASPQLISLPYKETGYFPEERPGAAGLKFKVKRGQKLFFQL